MFIYKKKCTHDYLPNIHIWNATATLVLVNHWPCLPPWVPFQTGLWSTWVFFSTCHLLWCKGEYTVLSGTANTDLQTIDSGSENQAVSGKMTAKQGSSPRVFWVIAESNTRLCADASSGWRGPPSPPTAAHDTEMPTTEIPLQGKRGERKGRMRRWGWGDRSQESNGADCPVGLPSSVYPRLCLIFKC